MPTTATQAINNMLDETRKGIALGMTTATGGSFIPEMLDIIETACNDLRPVYYEGLGRMHMLAGDYYYTHSEGRALSEYIFAIETLITYPLSGDSGDEQQLMLERALWRRFVLAKRLGDVGAAVQAADDALVGLVFPTATDSNPEDGSFVWGPVRLARVRGMWRQLQLMAYLARWKKQTTGEFGQPKNRHPVK